MKGQLIKGILIDTESQKQTVTEITDDLQEYYRILKCDLIDIVTRKIGGKCYDIVCDDEGNFKANPIVTAVNRRFRPMLVGNIFICNYAGDGELGSLTEEDIEHIKSNIVFDFVCDNGQISGCQSVVANMDYA